MKRAALSGFPELLPEQRVVEQLVIDDLRRTFELHGFASIQTRAVEPLTELTRKGEIDKEIYVLRRLQANPEPAAPPNLDPIAGLDPSTLGLHFDLTVPFARYVLENAGKLNFPFRRYQIQTVWRGERPQEGRYREFTQADIDVVGRDTLSFHHDVEVARVMAEALCQLSFLPPLRLQVNNRKLIEGFYLGVGASDVPAVMRAIDKLDKLPAAAVAALLEDQAGLSPEQAARCLALAGIRSTDTSFIEQVAALGVEHELLSEGLAELAAVMQGCAPLAGERFSVHADLSIARGLDYYTGTVFETRMAGHESLGSVCSGGRYDSLATDGSTSYPGVGISLGLTRLLVPLLARGQLVGSRSVPSAVLVALAGEDSRADAELVARALRSRGIAAEVAPSAEKFGTQIRHAARRGIPFVWFTATEAAGHEVKDIRSGEQVRADPGLWSPPELDRTPRIMAN